MSETDKGSMLQGTYVVHARKLQQDIYNWKATQTVT